MRTFQSLCWVDCGKLLREEWSKRDRERRPPVFIIVCKNTSLAKVIYQWLAEDNGARGDSTRSVSMVCENTDGSLSILYEWTPRSCVSPTAGRRSPTRTTGCARPWIRSGRSDWPRDGQGKADLSRRFRSTSQQARAALSIHPAAT